MDLKLVPEGNFEARLGKNSQKAMKRDAGKNPWRGKFERRQTPRDAPIAYSAPSTDNDESSDKPQAE